MGGRGSSRLQKVGRRAEGTTSRSVDEGKVSLTVLPACTLCALVHVLLLSRRSHRRGAVGRFLQSGAQKSGRACPRSTANLRPTRD